MFTCSNCGHNIDDTRVPLPPFCPRCGEPTNDSASPFDDDEPVSPLPPPINVSTPSPDAYGNDGSSPNPPYTASVGSDNPNRLTPPADIPVPMIAPPLDLRADAGATAPRPKTNVADEMLSGMKSMFHAVLPKGATPD